MKWEVIHNPVWAKTAMKSWQKFWFFHKQRLGFKGFVHTLIWAMVAGSPFWLGVGHTSCAVLAHRFSGFGYHGPNILESITGCFGLFSAPFFSTILCPLCLLSPPQLPGQTSLVVSILKYCSFVCLKLIYTMSVAFTPEEVHESSWNALSFVMRFTWSVWNYLYN